MGVYFLVNHMDKVKLSLYIEQNYPLSGRGGPRKPVHGVGTNDADYMPSPRVNGVQLCDPAYNTWVSVLQRSYSQKFHESNHTYSDVTVCSDWHSFSAFRAWWLENYREGGHLDKDLLVVGNREYGPDTCVYVPRWLNNLTTDRGALRGDLPIGTSLHKPTGKYQSNCCNPITGKQRTIGRFTTPEAAHEAWLNYKLALADKLKPDMAAIDQRIHPNVVTIIKALR